MNLLDNLALGFAAALQPQQLLLLLTGCLLGSLAAAKPRIGLLAASAMLLPVCSKLGLLPAMTLLVGVYCGAHGVAAADALVRSRGQLGELQDAALPAGLDAAATPALDSLKSAAPPLLVLLAALLGTAALASFAPLLVEVAFQFGPAEYFSMMAFGLMVGLVLAPGSLLKALSMLVLGLLLAQVSTDPRSGVGRFSFDLAELQPGIGFIPLAMGLLVIGRILGQPDPEFAQAGSLPDSAPRSSALELRRQWPQLLRGSAIGALLGVLPGGARLAGFVSLAAERRIRVGAEAVQAERLDQVGPSAALASGGQSSFVPLLALGFPVNATLALMTGVMLAMGIEAGPQMMTGKPDLFWGLIVATGLAALFLFVMARPLNMLSRRLQAVSITPLYPVVFVFCIIGAYALRSAAFDVFVMALFVFLGYLLYKLDCQIAPLILGFILGPMMESNLRHALELSDGDWTVLAVRPISGGLLLAAAILVATLMLPSVRKQRSTVFSESE